ncbi:hypothetical protein BZG75_11875 [Salinivibrio sp. AR640]|nr:hypothetical protein BZG75_11875 [Salinivibrio sp. AR640]
MESVSIYVAKTLIAQFISQEGYGCIKKALFPTKNYIDQLYQIIEETAIEFERIYPVETNKVPFYQSGLDPFYWTRIDDLRRSVCQPIKRVKRQRNIH